MEKQIVYITTRIIVRSELAAEMAAQELAEETDYQFSSTDNVTVLETEIIHTSTKP